MAKLSRSNGILVLELSLEEAIEVQADVTCGLCYKRITSTIFKPVNNFSNYCPNCIGRITRATDSEKYRKYYIESGEETVWKAKVKSICRRNGIVVEDRS
jgi:hypothetical protein